MYNSFWVYNAVNYIWNTIYPNQEHAVPHKFQRQFAVTKKFGILI